MVACETLDLLKQLISSSRITTAANMLLMLSEVGSKLVAAQPAGGFPCNARG
jgi:translation initiation factor 2B subunit (eIF-2B alpha/beta/delta family)